MVMKKHYTPRDAWEAFRDRKYELACHIWIKLMTEAQSIGSQRSYQLSYTHVLVAQHRYAEAVDILKELHESDPKPIYLHQLAFVAREAQEFSQARAYLHLEKQLIKPSEHLLLAGNEYEQGIVTWLEGNLESALAHAHKSLDHAQKADDQAAEGCVHRLIADLYKESGDQVQAMENYQAAQHAFLMLGDTLAAKDISRHLQESKGT